MKNIFVYGTLKGVGKQLVGKDIKATLKGWDLYMIMDWNGKPTYPTVKLSSNPNAIVHGEVLTDLGPFEVAFFDRYEGFESAESETNLYNKKTVIATLEDSSEIEVDVYEFNSELYDADLRKIEGGKF